MASDAQTEAVHPHKKQRLDSSYDILTCTAKPVPFSYVHLELITNPSPEPPLTSAFQQQVLDNLQLRSYCTSALRQLFGLTGVAVAIDILKVQGQDGWVRVPKADLSLFAAAVTAWRGDVEEGQLRALRVRQCSDWLGAMVGHDGQDRLWNC